jgi:hypothetical protein
MVVRMNFTVVILEVRLETTESFLREPIQRLDPKNAGKENRVFRDDGVWWRRDDKLRFVETI